MKRRVLVDTNVLVRASLAGFRSLSALARRVLADEAAVRLFSAVSLTEIAVKRSIGKLALEISAVDQLIEDLQLTVLPYTPRHARALFDLPLYHREPFDRMLIATALAEQIPLVTTDQELARYREAGLELIRA